MTILLFVFLGVLVVAAGTTMLAIARAKDGYEDEFGFHMPNTVPAPGTWQDKMSARNLPSGTGGISVSSESVMNPTPELPSALVEG